MSSSTPFITITCVCYQSEFSPRKEKLQLPNMGNYNRRIWLPSKRFGSILEISQSRKPLPTLKEESRAKSAHWKLGIKTEHDVGMAATKQQEWWKEIPFLSLFSFPQSEPSISWTKPETRVQGSLGNADLELQSRAETEEGMDLWKTWLLEPHITPLVHFTLTCRDKTRSFSTWTLSQLVFCCLFACLYLAIGFFNLGKTFTFILLNLVLWLFVSFSDVINLSQPSKPCVIYKSINMIYMSKIKLLNILNEKELRLETNKYREARVGHIRYPPCTQNSEGMPKDSVPKEYFHTIFLKIKISAKFQGKQNIKIVNRDIIHSG